MGRRQLAAPGGGVLPQPEQGDLALALPRTRRPSGDVMTTAVALPVTEGKRRTPSRHCTVLASAGAAALAAWQRCAASTHPNRCHGVDVLKESRSTAVYRLRGAGPA